MLHCERNSSRNVRRNRQRRWPTYCHTLLKSVILREYGPVNISLTPELERFIQAKVESGLYNNASEVIREGLRLLKEHDDLRRTWREQIECGWMQSQAGEFADGSKVIAEIRNRLKEGAKKRA